MSEMLYYVPLLGSLCWAAAHDLKTHTIPNRYTAILAVYSLFSVFVRADSWNSVPVLLMDSLLGCLLGGGLLLLASMLTKGGFGGGDIKLMAGLGLGFGVQGSMLILILAVVPALIIGIIQKRKQKTLRLPFAPFLLFGCVVTVIITL